MNAALVQDVVAEVMKRLNGRAQPAGPRHPSVPAGETAAAERRRDADVHNVLADNRYGVYSGVDQAVGAATESQKQLTTT